VPELPVDGHCDDGNQSEGRQLLEMHEVRRRVECGAVETGTTRCATRAVIRHLALPAAIDII